VFRSFRRRSAPISIGARFCRPDARYIVWEVRSLFIGLDDLPYAELFCVTEPTSRKVISRAALEDTKLYTPLPQDQPPQRARH